MSLIVCNYNEYERVVDASCFCVGEEFFFVDPRHPENTSSKFVGYIVRIVAVDTMVRYHRVENGKLAGEERFVHPRMLLADPATHVYRRKRQHEASKEQVSNIFYLKTDS